MDNVKQRSGKNSRIDVSGNTLAFAKWDVSFGVKDLDTTNFESNGYGEGISGIEQADISFGGDWDAGENPFDTPPGIYPRDDLAALKFYENVIDNIYWSFAYARLRSCKNGASVDGKVTFETSGMSQGVVAVPTGSV